MAEIHIERKERTTWPWIVLGLILLSLLAWWLLSQRGDRDGFAVLQDTTGQVIDTVGGTAAGVRDDAPEDVAAFVRWTDESRARQEEDTSHAHTADGIRQLAAAIESLADRDTAGMEMVRQRADSIRGLADALERDWESPNHAQHARQAFLEASELMDQLRTQRYPNSANDVAMARQAAQNVQPAQPLLAQRQQVQQFFDRAATALQTMGNTRT